MIMREKQKPSTVFNAQYLLKRFNRFEYRKSTNHQVFYQWLDAFWCVVYKLWRFCSRFEYYRIQKTMATIKWNEIITKYQTEWHTHKKPLELFTSWSEKFKWLPRIVIHVISTAMCVRVWERAALSILCATCVLNESVHIHGIHNLVCSQRFFEYIYLWNAIFLSLANYLF